MTDPVSTLYLFRHAHRYGGADVLDDQGKREAEAIARTLADEDIRSIFTTRANRTRQTVTPLADQADVKIEISDDLTTSGEAVLEQLVSMDGGAVVVCTHDMHAAAIGQELVGLAKDPRLAKELPHGAGWALTWDGDSLGATYVPSPSAQRTQWRGKVESVGNDAVRLKLVATDGRRKRFGRGSATTTVDLAVEDISPKDLAELSKDAEVAVSLGEGPSDGPPVFTSIGPERTLRNPIPDSVGANPIQ